MGGLEGGAKQWGAVRQQGCVAGAKSYRVNWRSTRPQDGLLHILQDPTLMGGVWELRSF